jgi:serine/threonine protein kinase/Flp pilus assembly protein TadD
MENSNDNTRTHIVLTKGTMVSHYRIVEKIGAGGMGEVYLAEDTKLKRQVALKFLPDQLAKDSDFKARFVREAEATAKLNHPNIITIYEVAEYQGRPFFAMELVEGQSLRDLAKGKELNVDRIIELVMQICDGLSAAHDKKVVHRDIKPSNIAIDAYGRPKILDFGLAAIQGGEHLTKTGSALGTVGYMSPEQVQGKDVDQRSDLFSLGVVLYELIASRTPFRRDNDMATGQAIIGHRPEPLARYRSNVSEDLQRIVFKLLEKDSGLRYQSAAGLTSDLKRLRKQSESIPSTLPPKPSIAVLPFANLSVDPEQEYFCDGMAEEIINALTHIKDLRVIARTSAFAFKGKQEDVREIGRKLDVETLLEGSVRKAGNRLRITAQLIKVADGSHIWSERYDRDMEDIFAIQDSIAQAILEQMKVKLVRKLDDPIVRKQTENLEAYSLVLKGRHHWYNLSPEGWRKSLECFQEAIDVDPDYAGAYAWIAIWYQSQGFWGELPPELVHTKTMAAAERALQLDDTIADVHNLLAVVFFSHDWDWEAAQRSFDRSIELSPTVALAHMNYAVFLLTQKRFEEAYAEAEIARKLDPLSAMVNTWAAYVSFHAGKTMEAIDQLKVVIAMDPGYWQPFYFLGFLYQNMSLINDAIVAAEKACELSGGASISLGLLSSCYYLAGRTDEAKKMYGKLKKRSQTSYVPPMFFAWIHFARNEVDEGISWLEKAEKEHDSWLCWAAISPHPKDKRIEAIFQRIGLV